MSIFQNDIDAISQSVSDLTQKMVKSLSDDQTLTDDNRKSIAIKNGLVIALLPARVFLYALTGQEATPDQLRRFLNSAVADYEMEKINASRH